MSLTRKFLAAMGIEPEKIDEIITAHTETVNALKEERDKYKTDAEKLPDVQKKLDEATVKVKEYEDSDEKDKWKVKYDALREEYDEYKAGIDEEKSKNQKANAYRKLLKDAGVSEKRIDAVMRVTDLKDMELDDSGALKNAENLTETIKSEWAEFITERQEKGADTTTPPGEAGKNGAGDRSTPSRAAQVAAKHYEMLYGKKAEENK